MRKVELAVAGLCAAMALFLIYNGLPLANNTERFYRAPGQIEWLEWGIINERGTHEVSLLPGQSVDYTNDLSTARSTYCFNWQTTFGPRSLNIQAWILQSGSGQWRRIDPNEPCYRGGQLRITLTNGDRAQVARFLLRINHHPLRSRPEPRSRGQISPVCSDCPPISVFDRVSDFQSMQQRGQTMLWLSAALSLFATAAFLGASTTLGLLYEVGRTLFPSQAAARVRQSLKSAKSGAGFDPTSTDGYNAGAGSRFRRQQDIDDMRSLTAEIKAETERLRQAETKMRDTKMRDQESKKRLLDEYEAAVRRVKELQQELEKKGF